MTQFEIIILVYAVFATTSVCVSLAQNEILMLVIMKGNSLLGQDAATRLRAVKSQKQYSSRQSTFGLQRWWGILWLAKRLPALQILCSANFTSWPIRPRHLCSPNRPTIPSIRTPDSW